ncbi:MAG: bifunctional 4-hydroxy-2-oxoglutarate aldolase/2-dehydro-3-deoxy-phosphogluconate aldolase [Pirellulaceae bacterium]|nr:bifunctional 4-hydroxy-2-oxoglutarate aldolase/2-dehydro-3-deoxy-phosphogluconate aldolase [Pirellulaceae bacterium]
MKSQVLQLIQRLRIVAIVRLDDLSQAVNISSALAAGGILAQEFTLTNPDALRVLPEVKQSLTSQGYETAIGVGSVRNLTEAQAALAAQADFIVSPITSVPIIQACRQAQVAVMPGAYTPTEIALAWDSGADVVKVFPARALGPGYIKDVLAPMPYLKLMPTGGVDLTNIKTFLTAGAVALGIGGNLIDAKAIQASDWAAVTNIARQYSEAAAHA